ncbi:hypothetical protein JYU34_007887 [Plutella xylostella]|uniref:Uncharacterized protein n=1 Tax=Plutella xylostella TaxID=51655 RepID=A0ABQ7QRK8_PLUXY|nr:hypothetical protein JYU34_007887 [Plutella xylostella]
MQVVVQVPAPHAAARLHAACTCARRVPVRDARAARDRRGSATARGHRPADVTLQIPPSPRRSRKPHTRRPNSSEGTSFVYR